MFLFVTYVVPIVSMTFTYARIGIELWGSQSIGECTQRQMDNIKSKRRVSIKYKKKTDFLLKYVADFDSQFRILFMFVLLYSDRSGFRFSGFRMQSSELKL